MKHLLAIGLTALSVVALFGPDLERTVAAQTSESRPALTARLSRWQSDPVKKKKGPRGFDLQFQLVGARFDGAFGLEGVPKAVPEGEAFDTQIKLTNVGAKAIRVASVTVTGDGIALTTDLLARRVDAKASASVARFKVPPQSFAGSTFLISVTLTNGDRHTATLTFARAS